MASSANVCWWSYCKVLSTELNSAFLLYLFLARSSWNASRIPFPVVTGTLSSITSSASLYNCIVFKCPVTVKRQKGSKSLRVCWCFPFARLSAWLPLNWIYEGNLIEPRARRAEALHRPIHSQSVSTVGLPLLPVVVGVQRSRCVAAVTVKCDKNWNSKWVRDSSETVFYSCFVLSPLFVSASYSFFSSSSLVAALLNFNHEQWVKWEEEAP